MYIIFHFCQQIPYILHTGHLKAYLLFIISKYNVVHFQYVPKQALKSWKERVYLEEHRVQVL